LRISRPRPGSLVASIAIAAAMLGMTLGLQVPGVAASTADAQAGELVRLINGTRAAAGLPAVATDGLLSSLARDGASRCGDTPYKAIAGRARDFATYKYLDHRVRNCLASSFSLSKLTFVSVLQSDFGFGSVGEIVAMNSGYGTAAYQYTYGGWTTSTTATAGHAMGTSTSGWMGSSTHRAIILGGYNRVGCGAWYLNGGYYYDCLFSIGGGHAWSRPATTAAPPAVPTRAPVATSQVAPTAGSSPAPTGSASGSTPPLPSASSSEEVAGMVAPTASPTLDAAAIAQLDSGSITVPNRGTLPRDQVLRGALLATTALVLFAAGGLMLRLRRRGRRRTTV
jgi:uncharacterized protein YkwD